MVDMHLSWETVSGVAASLGAKEHARRKWRTRRVIPAKWQIAICRALGEQVTLDDLSSPALWSAYPEKSPRVEAAE